MVISSLMPLILLSGMRREDDSESQNSAFTVGAGARSNEIIGRKIDSTGVIAVEAETGTSGIAVGVEVTVVVGMVVVITPVRDKVTIGEIVSVITGVTFGKCVFVGATEVISTVGVREVSSVVVNWPAFAVKTVERLIIINVAMTLATSQ